jgi:hypothetical protein
VHTTFAPVLFAPVFPRSPGGQRRGPGGLGGRLGGETLRTVVLGTTVVVGSTNVVVVGGLLGAVIGGVDVGATVEGTAVVEVGAEVGGRGEAVEFFAIALDSPLAAPEQAAVPRPNTTSAETVTNLILRI